MKLGLHRFVAFQIIGAVWRRVWKHHKGFVAFSVAAGVALGMLGSANIWISREIVDGLGVGDAGRAGLCVALYFAAQAASLALEFARNVKESRFNERFATESEALFLRQLSERELLERETPSFHTKSAFWQEAIQQYLPTYSHSVQLVQRAAGLAAGFALLSSLQWWIALIVTVCVVGKAFIQTRNTAFRIDIVRRLQEQSRRTGYCRYLLTDPLPQKELALYEMSERLLNVWRAGKRKENELALKLQLSVLRPGFASQIVSTTMVALVMGLVSSLVLRAQLTVGDYVAIVVAVGTVEGGVAAALEHVAKLRESTAIIARYELESGKEEEERPPVEASRSFVFEREIVVSRLTFRYPNQSKPALRDVSLQIRSGEKVVILGDNAAGKTTLAKLLLGLYRAPEGTIYYDGTDQTAIDRRMLWKRSGALFQDYMNYMMKVRENVAMGDPNKLEDEAALLSALERVGLSVDAFPDGLDTELGYFSDRAVNLSGGQWQRLGLARTLLRGGSLLVLDEPTAALDPNAELHILDSILRHSEGQTLIIVSHRVGVAARADKIVVMREGEIAEVGAHAELIARNGRYADMWRQQKALYEIDGREAG